VTAELYNDAILAEAKAGHANGRLDAPDVTVTCDNPLCGDRVTVDLRLDQGYATQIGQHTRGCLLTQAAASVVGRHATGGSAVEVEAVIHELRRLLAGEAVEPRWPELAMFAPVSAVRSRHECVLLPLEALQAALTKGRSG
jgi:NifU-like protein involved in Fe-S cluster formation